MVDFAVALKLSMPIAVLSAIKEARNRNVNVKGGKFLESIADADTIVLINGYADKGRADCCEGRFF